MKNIATNLTNEDLLKLHEDVPADHYDRVIRKSFLSKIWHGTRFNHVLKAIKKVDGPILDIGCHGGTFTKRILSTIGNKDLYGIDISPNAVALASKKIPSGHFQVADAQSLPFGDSYFSAVFCLEVLEHIDNPGAVLEGIKRVLKPGGYALILVPTDNFLFRLGWFIWNLYSPVWKHVHVQSFRGQSLEEMISKTGLEVLSSKTFNFGMLKLVVVKKHSRCSFSKRSDANNSCYL